jgi:membrane protein YqaA with SNARE-associated domain
MNLTEAYNFLLVDSIMNMLLLTPHSGFVYDVMLIFGTYNYYIIYALVVLGNIIGATINWYFGNILKFVEKTEAVTVQLNKYNVITKYFNLLTPFLLTISFLPVLGPLLTTACGLFKVRLPIMLTIFTLSQMIYYGKKILF